MVNKNDTVNIHDGVALVLCRHDDAQGQNITGVGAAWAYALGKFMGDIFEIDSPQYIIHSPIARARNTAKMHQIAMKVNDISFPRMQYDPRLHESASVEMAKQAVIDAINELSFYGIKTLEVVTHSNTPINLAKAFGAKCEDVDLGYGGIVVLYADTWQDLLDGKVGSYRRHRTSKDAVFGIMGEEQIEILEHLFANENIKRENEWGGYDYIDITSPNFTKSKYEETLQWLKDIEEGKDVKTIVPPVEYLEIYDAYKFWMQNLAIAAGITPPENSPVYSELAKKLLGRSNQTFAERFFINEPEYDNDDYAASGMGNPYPIWNAVAKKIEQRRGISMSSREAGNQVVSDMLEDFPGYRDAMLVGQARDVDGDTEVVAKSGDSSYYVKDGDDGEGHPALNAVIWRKLKEKESM